MYLVLLGKGCNVVLEGVSYPSALHPYVRDTLQHIPGLLTRANGSINELIKVLVVRENDVATHVKQETLLGLICAGETTSLLCLQQQGS